MSGLRQKQTSAAVAKSLRGLALVAACFFASCSSRGAAVTEIDNGDLGKGRMLDSDGNVRAFSDFRGGVILLNFWASWCVECLAEFPTLVNLQRQFPADELQVVSVLEDDDPENLKQLSISATELGFPILIDSEGVLKRRYNIRGLPTTMVLDCGRKPLKLTDPLQGVEAEKIVGGREWDSPAVVEQLKNLSRSAGCR
jgi:thiol-disulfide isomerase/thioredoxin